MEMVLEIIIFSHYFGYYAKAEVQKDQEFRMALVMVWI
jgi:uncharacterized membrane protein